MKFAFSCDCRSDCRRLRNARVRTSGMQNSASAPARGGADASARSALGRVSVSDGVRGGRAARERRRRTGLHVRQFKSRRGSASVLPWERMLTRSQVARRIGKSIATVRRLEGRVLHPLLGDGDVRLFHESEVERLRDKPGEIARWGRSDWFQRRRARQARTPGAHRVGVGQSSAEAAGAIMDVLEAMLAAPPRMLLRLGIDERMMRNLVRAAEVVGGD